MAEYIAGEAALLVVPSVKGFKKDLQAKLTAELKDYRPEIIVKPVLDKKALADVAAEIESVKTLGRDKSNIRLGVTLDKRSLAESTAEIEALQKGLGAKSVKIKIDSGDVDNARKKIQSVDRGLAGLSREATRGILFRVAFLGLPAALAGIASLNTAVVELSRGALLLPGALAAAGSSLATLFVGASGVKTALQAANKAQQDTAQSAQKLADANRGLHDAQQDLNRSYRDAKRDLEDLYAQMRDAPLDEAEARLRVDEARNESAKRYGKTQLDQQKDALSLQRAQNDLDNVLRKNTRTQEDYTDAAAKGVSGSDKVTSATERLTKAMETLNSTVSKTDIADALSKLSPSAAAFVTQLESMRSQWDGFRKDVQQHLFAGLSDDVGKLGTLLPTVETGFDRIADSLNNNLRTAVSALTSSGNKPLLDQIFGNTADVQKKLSSAIDPFVHAMLQLSATGSGALPKLAKGFGDLAQTFDSFITNAARDGSLDKWINEGIKAASDLGDTFINVGKILGQFSDIFTAAGGKSLTEVLKDATQNLSNFLNTASGKAEVKQFFTDVLNAVQKWGPILKDIPGLFVNVVSAAGQIGTAIIPILRTFADLLSNTNPIVYGIITAFLAWKTFHPIILESQNLLSKFTTSASKTSEAVGDESGKKGLRGALGSVAGFLKSTLWIAAISGAIDELSGLTDAHNKAARAASEQESKLDSLKSTLDQVTGNATAQTIGDTSKNFQDFKLLSGKSVNLNSDAAGLGINPSDAVLAASDPSKSDQKNKFLKDLDQKAEENIGSSDSYKRTKAYWDANGIDLHTLALAANQDPVAMKRVEDARKTPIDSLPFGLGDAAKGLLHITDDLLPITAQPDASNVESLSDLQNLGGAASSLASGIRGTSSKLGPESQAIAGGSNVASGAPNGWQLAPSNPFASYDPDGHPRRDASGQGHVTLNHPPSQLPSLFSQPGWDVGSPAYPGGPVTITLPKDAADQYLQKVPGYATGGQVWGWGSGTSDSNLARVSKGEFISNASSVDRYGPDFYHALNSGSVDPGMLPGFAGGDLVDLPLTPFTPVVPAPPAPDLVTPPSAVNSTQANVPFGLPPPGTGLTPSPKAIQIPGIGDLPIQHGGGQSAGPGGPVAPSPGGGAPLIAAPGPKSADIPLPSPQLSGAVPPGGDTPPVPDLGDLHTGLLPSPAPSSLPQVPPGAPPPSITNPAPGAPPLDGLLQTLNPANLLQRIGQILLSAFLGFFGINPQPILGLIQQVTGGAQQALGGAGDPAVTKILQNQPGRNQTFDPNQVGGQPGSTPPGASGPAGKASGHSVTLPDGTKIDISENAASKAHIPLGGSTTQAVKAAGLSPLYKPGTAFNYGAGAPANSGVPPEIFQIGKAFGLEPSTYPDGGTLHQSGFAFDFRPSGVAWNSAEGQQRMDAFSSFVQDNLGDQTLELIHQDLNTKQRFGVAGGQDVRGWQGDAAHVGYFGVGDQGYGGHEDHVHWATDVAPLVQQFTPWAGFPGAPAGPGLASAVTPQAAIAPGGPLNPASNQTDVARSIIGQAQARGYNPQQTQAILSAAYQESGLSPTASGGGGAWKGIFQQDSGYAGRDDPNQNISGFLDRLGSHGGPTGDIWKNIFWLQQRPGETSADSAFANGRQGYLSEIQSKLGPSQALYNQIVNAQGHATGGMLSGPGSGTSDSILARVSDGEFISKAASVDKYGPDFYHALNQGVIDPKMLQGFADGGQPDPNQDLKKLLQGVPDAAQSSGPLPTDVDAQHLQGADSAGLSAGHLNGPMDLGPTAGSLNPDGGALGPPTPVTDVSPQPGAQAPIGASATPDPRSQPAFGPTNQQQQHTAPWLDQAVRQGINYAGQIGSAVASAAGGAAGTFGGGAAGAAAGIAISQGAQVAADVASGALNVLSSLGVGTLTPGTTAGAYGSPLLPQQQQPQVSGPAIVNNYGDVHTASYSQWYQGQQLREAQQMAPLMGSLPA